MKNASAEAKRWLAQAKRDLGFGQLAIPGKYFEHGCFLAEQAAQKALKAFLLFKGSRYVFEHSVQVLARRCTEADKDFVRFVSEGGLLDQYYTAPRYPDAVNPPAIPGDIYTREQAQQALSVAQAIIQTVASKLTSHRTPDGTP